MNKTKLIIKSLLYYWRSNLAIIAGVSLSAGIIIGALSIGHSVKSSLLTIVKERLGLVENALISSEKIFNLGLCDRISKSLPNSTNASLLILAGRSINPANNKQLNRVNIIGIDDNFHKFSLNKSPLKNHEPRLKQRGINRKIAEARPKDLKIAEARPKDLQIKEASLLAIKATCGIKKMDLTPFAIVNTTFAKELGLNIGDDLVLQIETPSILPGDWPLLSKKSKKISIRIKITDIAGEKFPGNFTFQNSQLAPANIFLPIEWLGEKINKKGKANVIISRNCELRKLQEALNSTFTLEDIGLRYTEDPNGLINLKSDSIFIPEMISKIALKESGAQGVLSYFVNSIELLDKNGNTIRSTPYSFITGIGSINNIASPLNVKNSKKQACLTIKKASLLAINPLVELNEWVANDLKAKVGDKIKLKYYIPGPFQKLDEGEAIFTVKSIISMKDITQQKNLNPDFPGLSDSDNCVDWDASIPINLDLIRDKDEAYWDRYKETPKGIISLPKAQSMWGNKFGNLTTLLFHTVGKKTSTNNIKKAKLNSLVGLKKLRSSLNCKDFGLQFTAVKKDGQFAAKNGVDFGGLFIGLSFFIIFAGLILTISLFLISLASRTKEFYIMNALGFTHCEVRNLFFAEGAIIATLGSLLGAPLGILYNNIILYLLKSIWNDALGTDAIQINLKIEIIIIGILIAIAVSFCTILFSLKIFLKKSKLSPSTNNPLWPKIYLFFASLLFVSATSITIYSLFTPFADLNIAAFFASGGMLLISLWLFIRYLIFWVHKHNLLEDNPSSFKLALKNSTHKPLRTMSAITILSCGIFLTIAVAINKRTTPNPLDKNSGTGGYSLFITTTTPIMYDLNSEKGKTALGLDKELFKKCNFVNLSLSEGDNASCLNLNRVTRPSILGVDFAKFANPERFTFVGLAGNSITSTNWTNVSQLKDGNISAVGDQEVIFWSMGKSIGSKITIQDEKGKEHKIELNGALASSIFQGYILIPKKQFDKLFPSIGGSQCLLVETTPNNIDKVESALKTALSEYGANITTCPKRLDKFYKIANRYLSIFLTLGGLGLLIGTAGFGIVVFKNLDERKFEISIMNATGFNKQLIRKIIIIEHSLIVIAATLSGAISAFIAVLPTILQATYPPPYRVIATLLLTIIAFGITSLYLSARFATYSIKKPQKTL